MGCTVGLEGLEKREVQAPPGNRTVIRRLSSLYTSHCTDYTLVTEFLMSCNVAEFHF